MISHSFFNVAGLTQVFSRRCLLIFNFQFSILNYVLQPAALH